MLSTLEVVVLTLTKTWTSATVYFDGRGNANAASARVRVYAVSGGIRALVAAYVATDPAQAYAWTIQSEGADRFEVTIQAAAAATSNEVGVAVVGFGTEPSAPAILPDRITPFDSDHVAAYAFDSPTYQTTIANEAPGGNPAYVVFPTEVGTAASTRIPIQFGCVTPVGNGIRFDSPSVGTATFGFQGFAGPTAAITLEAFVRLESSAANSKTIINKNGSFLFYIDNTNLLTFLLVTNTGTTSITCLASNVSWIQPFMHVMATYDGAFMRLYIDGDLVASGAKTGAIQYTASDVSIGSAVSALSFASENPRPIAMARLAISRIARTRAYAQNAKKRAMGLVAA